MTRTATDTWFRRGPEFLSEKDSAFNISIDSSIVKKVPATMEAENNDDIEIDDEPRGAKIKAFIKLATIVICYATAFVSLVQLGFWLVHDPEFGPVILHTPVMSKFFGGLLDIFIAGISLRLTLIQLRNNNNCSMVRNQMDSWSLVGLCDIRNDL